MGDRPPRARDRRDGVERADNYMLAVDLFASSLVLSSTLFLGTAIWLATLPAQLTMKG